MELTRRKLMTAGLAWAGVATAVATSEPEGESLEDLLVWAWKNRPDDGRMRGIVIAREGEKWRVRVKEDEDGEWTYGCHRDIAVVYHTSLREALEKAKAEVEGH